MANSVWFISYKLKKGASVADFLIAAEKTNNEVLSAAKTLTLKNFILSLTLQPLNPRIF